MRRAIALPTYLSHDLTQCHLFEVGGFPTHVGSSDDNKIAAFRDVAVVRHRLLSSHSLQNGMATLLDGQCVCEFWTHLEAEKLSVFIHVLNIFKKAHYQSQYTVTQ